MPSCILSRILIKSRITACMSTVFSCFTYKMRKTKISVIKLQKMFLHLVHSNAKVKAVEKCKLGNLSLVVNASHRKFSRNLLLDNDELNSLSKYIGSNNKIILL